MERKRLNLAAILAACTCLFLTTLGHADTPTSPYPDTGNLRQVVAARAVHSHTAESLLRFDWRDLQCRPVRSYLVSVFLKLGQSRRDRPDQVHDPRGPASVRGADRRHLHSVPGGETVPQNIEFCREGSDVVDVLELKIDGELRNDLIERRAETRPFSVDLPKDNAFGYPPGIVIAVHEGFFATIPPLPPGVHTMRVRGGIASIGLEFDTRYRLEIVQPARALPVTPK